MLHLAPDVAVARAFYAEVLPDADVEIEPLPEAALARGAPARWIGAIAVNDVTQIVAKWVARGATQLAPIVRVGGGTFATVRDTGGAVVALTTASIAPQPPMIVWSHLDTRDAETAFGVYTDLFGWHPIESLQRSGAGSVMQFAWKLGGQSVGSYADIGSRPGIRSGWMFHFRVDDLDSAANAVRSCGGAVLADATAPSGARAVVCDDSQGAGFVLSNDP